MTTWYTAGGISGAGAGILNDWTIQNREKLVSAMVWNLTGVTKWNGLAGLIGRTDSSLTDDE